MFDPFDKSLISVLDCACRALSGRAFAYGDLCSAAVNYGAPYEGMSDYSLAALRPDYDGSLRALEEAIVSQGYLFDGYVPGLGPDARKPFVRLAANEAALSAGQYVGYYPLDCIPVQSTLRFRVFKESSQAMARYASMEKSADFGDFEAFRGLATRLCRYNKANTGVWARLFGYSASGAMGERTIFQRSVLESDVYPLREVPFRDGTVGLTRNVSNWTLEMTEGRQKVIDIVQKESLESLSEVDRVCNLLGIEYFLVGGSMLGAIRHKGFIPWDDDTDIGMLRADYKRFCKEAPKYLDPQYFIQLPSTDEHIHFVYARLRKSGIQYITMYNEDKDFNKGIWVDIFPFDVRPKSQPLAKVQNKLANIAARASMTFKRRREYAFHDVEVPVDPQLLEDPVIASDMRYLKRYRSLSRLFPVAFARGVYHAAAGFLNFRAGKPGTMYASFIPSYTTISEEDIRPLQRVPYEDAELCIPAGAEGFLTRQYGDFMSLPPLHQRYAEHGFKCLKAPDGTIYEA